MSTYDVPPRPDEGSPRGDRRHEDGSAALEPYYSLGAVLRMSCRKIQLITSKAECTIDNLDLISSYIPHVDVVRWVKHYIPLN